MGLFNWKAKRVKTIERRLANKLRATATTGTAVNAQGLFNFRCFENAVQYAKDNEGFGIQEVILVAQNDECILHYVNSKDGILYETTLGWRHIEYEYFVQREVTEAEWNSIHSSFTGSLDMWLYECTNWFDRKVLSISRIV